MSPQHELLLLIRDARARGFELNDEVLRREILALVDERQRQAMTLYWLEDLTQAETARTMGITQKRVSELVAAGCRNLAARIALLATRV